MAKKNALNCKKVYKMMESIYDGNMSKELVKEEEIVQLLQTVREVFLSQPMLLELEPPINVCGDIHGQYDDLKRLFDKGGWPPEKNYLFLGDYVDRGSQGMETIVFLLALKYLFPENFFLLRGNHESDMVNKIYGFFDECKSRYSVKLWKEFINVFDVMPVAAIIGDKIFCCHGGISPDLVDAKSLSALETAKRPCKIPEKGLLCDLVWADPAADDDEGFNESDRGVSFTFGKDVLKRFLDHFEFDLLCRAHQVVEMGYEFFADQKGLTVFSAPNYCGEYDNAAALLVINEDLMCQFELLPPTDEDTMQQSQTTTKLADRLQYGGVVAPELIACERVSSSNVAPMTSQKLMIPFSAARSVSSDMLAAVKLDSLQMSGQPPFQQPGAALVRLARVRPPEYQSMRTPFDLYATPCGLYTTLPRSGSLALAGDRSSLPRGFTAVPFATSQSGMLNVRPPMPRDATLTRLGIAPLAPHLASQKVLLARCRAPSTPSNLSPFMFAPQRNAALYASAFNASAAAPEHVPQMQQTVYAQLPNSPVDCQSCSALPCSSFPQGNELKAMGSVPNNASASTSALGAPEQSASFESTAPVGRSVMVAAAPVVSPASGSELSETSLFSLKKFKQSKSSKAAKESKKHK